MNSDQGLKTTAVVGLLKLNGLRGGKRVGVCDIYIVCDIIVIVVLTMCNLTISSILQKPNKTPTKSTHVLAYVVMKRVKQCACAFRVCSFTA